MLRYSLWLILFVVLALPCGAGEPAGPRIIDNSGQGGDESIFKPLFDEVKKSGVHEWSEGIGTVSPGQVAICRICLQPLYKHADPGFKCEPPDKKVQSIQTVKVTCPVCQAIFEGALYGNINTKAGVDKDFCIHSQGKYAMHSKVWVCPDCGYAALIDLFGSGWDKKPVDEATKAFVHEKLSPGMHQHMIKINGLNRENENKILPDLLKFSTYVPQQNIPDWIKYENAQQIYVQEHAPHALLATLFLEGAHAYRREICSEVAVTGLHNSVEATLSASIRRANYFVLQEIMALHKQHDLDPSKAEMDPKILLQAIENILQKDEAGTAVQPRPGAPAANKSAGLWVGDKYVLLLRQAGALDRLGRMKEAEKVLESARREIPSEATLPPGEAQNQDLSRYFEKQLALLQDTAAARLECLKNEREYLFKAAKHYIAALKFQELLLQGIGQPDTANNRRLCDAALASYLLGETLRRAGVLPEAAAWFDACDRICAKNLELLEKAAPPPPPQDAAVPAEKNPRVEHYASLQSSAKEQRAMFEVSEAPDEMVREVVAMALQSAGLTSAAPAGKSEAGTPAAATKAAAAPVAPAAPKIMNIKTREQLYKLYYDALLRFRKDKNKNPDRLVELVEGKYITPEDSNLNEKGKLICPETQEGIGYQHTWEPGDKTAPILFPLKSHTKLLFANGEIREGNVEK
jgi:hypothetical protein